MPPPPITDPAELVAYSDYHLRYEIDMLRDAAVHMGITQPWFLRCATIEAFAQHLRNLIEFLFPDKFPPRDKDVRAHHFLAQPEPYDYWRKIRGPISQKLVEAKIRADTELAHLTTLRKTGTPANKRWHRCVLLPELNKFLSVFAAQADPNRLGPDARAAIAELSTWVTNNCAGGKPIPFVGSLTTSTPITVGSLTKPDP